MPTRCDELVLENAHLRAELERVIATVGNLHRPALHNRRPGGNNCAECGFRYPCATVEAARVRERESASTHATGED